MKESKPRFPGARRKPSQPTAVRELLLTREELPTQESPGFDMSAMQSPSYDAFSKTMHSKGV